MLVWKTWVYTESGRSNSFGAFLWNSSAYIIQPSIFTQINNHREVSKGIAANEEIATFGVGG